MTLRILTLAAGDSLLHSSREPCKRGKVGSHRDGQEVPRGAKWNIPTLIPLGPSSLWTFFRLMYNDILGASSFLSFHVSVTHFVPFYFSSVSHGLGLRQE